MLNDSLQASVTFKLTDKVLDKAAALLTPYLRAMVQEDDVGERAFDNLSTFSGYGRYLALQLFESLALDAEGAQSS